MGLYDRDYTQASYDSQHRYTGPQMRIGFPKVPSVVKGLLIINIAVFIPIYLVPAAGNFLITHFSVFPYTFTASLQPWRFITYQFLHDPGGFGHIFFNMLGLFFFGPMLERLWGPRKFLFFYLICGAMGGVLYTFLILVGWLSLPLPLIGASGAILGTIAATTVLYPKARVYVWGVFPMPLIVLSGILALFSILTLLSPSRRSDAGGEAAHLAGLAAGAIYVLSQNWRTRLNFKLRSRYWQKTMGSQQNLRAEVDRILQKVHEHGLQSLTRNEKKILQKATHNRQNQKII